MSNVAQNTSTRPSAKKKPRKSHPRPMFEPRLSAVPDPPVQENAFDARVSEIYRMHRGTSPASVLEWSMSSIRMIVAALESDPDCIATSTMVSQLLEVAELVDAVAEEIRPATEHDAEFAAGARIALASRRAREVGSALLRMGEKHDRFIWAAMLMRLDSAILSESAMAGLCEVAAKVSAEASKMEVTS